MLGYPALFLIAVLAAAAPRADAGDASHITPDEFLAALQSDHPPLVIDARSQREYDAGHVPGAQHIPFYSVFAHRSELASGSQPVVVYCAHGPRAGIAKLQLWAMGFDRVRYLAGHMAAWNARGLPIETGGE
jgi:rhodanese-related sulfurtransferase